MSRSGRKAKPQEHPDDEEEDRLRGLEARLDAVEARVDVQGEQVADVVSDQTVLRGELAASGAAVVENPSRRRTKMTPAQRRAIKRQVAARARAAKPVGRGMGAVKTAATKAKLEQQAGIRRGKK